MPMRFPFVQFAFLGLLVTNFFACKTTQPIRPVEVYNEDNRFTKRSSVLRIPIQIDLAKLEFDLNTQLSEGPLYEDNSFEDGDKMKVTARKDGDIRLSAGSTAMRYQVPLDLWIQ